MSTSEWIRCKPKLFIQDEDNQLIEIGYRKISPFFSAINDYVVIPIFDDISLRKVRLGDEDEIFDIIMKNTDQFSMTMDWVKKINSVSDVRKFIVSMIDASEINTEHNYVICKGKKIIGNISFRSSEEKTMNIGYWLDIEFQGSGVMFQCVDQVSELFLKNKIYNKIRIFVIDQNMKSRNVAIKAGYTLVGTLKNQEKLNGRLYDQCIFERTGGE